MLLIEQEKKIGRHIIDEVGNRYERLTVLERAQNSRRGQAQWLCDCDCGATSIVPGTSLRKGYTKSCGCLRVESRRLPRGEAAFNLLWWKIKGRQGHKFNLTKEQVRNLVTQPCQYCGILPAQISKGKGLYGDFLYNGIDRVDSNLGYVEGNVVPCCWSCNRAKSSSTVEEFKAWVVRAYEHLTKDQRE